MARPEQVLVLEPQHELKFRGNAEAEGRAGGGALASQRSSRLDIQCLDVWINQLKCAKVFLFVVAAVKGDGYS